MDLDRIGGLIQPFLADVPGPARLLSDIQLSSISVYVELLLRWNTRINLTSIRDSDEIVTRHFGESLFAARHLFPDLKSSEHLIDVGSGAGFPGLPIKLWAQEIELTLIESNHKKATFLRETIRALKLEKCEVFAGRAETFPGLAKVVTLRAVEHFGTAFQTAISLVKPEGKIALFITEDQKKSARALASSVKWLDPLQIPGSIRRILFIGRKNQGTHEPV